MHLVGILFPHINDDARSKSHQIPEKSHILFTVLISLCFTAVDIINRFVSKRNVEETAYFAAVKIFTALGNISRILTANQQMFEVMKRGNIRHRNQPLILHVPYVAYNPYDGNKAKIYSKHKDALFIHETWGTAPLHDNYLLTPCSRVLLEKLTGSQIVKKLPAFYGTRKLITAFTSARHLSIS